MCHGTQSKSQKLGVLFLVFLFLFFQCNFPLGNPVVSQLNRMDLNPRTYHSLAVRSQQNSFLSLLQSLLRAVRPRKETKCHSASSLPAQRSLEAKGLGGGRVQVARVVRGRGPGFPELEDSPTQTMTI